MAYRKPNVASRRFVENFRLRNYSHSNLFYVINPRSRVIRDRTRYIFAARNLRV